jgi:hypothetical protein
MMIIFRLTYFSPAEAATIFRPALNVIFGRLGRKPGVRINRPRDKSPENTVMNLDTAYY